MRKRDGARVICSSDVLFSSFSYSLSVGYILLHGFVLSFSERE